MPYDWTLAGKNRGPSAAQEIKDKFYALVSKIDAKLGAADLGPELTASLKRMIDSDRNFLGIGSGAPQDVRDLLIKKLGLKSDDELNRLVSTLSVKKAVENPNTVWMPDTLMQSASVINGVVSSDTFEQEVAQDDASTTAAEDAALANDPITQEIQNWIKSNQGPLRPDDQIAQGLSAFGGAQAQRQAAGQGIVGGLSGANTEQAAMNALAPYLQQRHANVLSGLNAMSARDIGARQIAMGEAQQANSIAQANYAARQNSAASTGSLIGGALGAIPGVLLAPYTGGASMGLIGAGSAIGGGIGGSTVRAPAMQSSTYRGGFKPNGGAW